MTTAPPVIDNNDGPPENLDPIPRNRYGAPRAPHPYTGKTVTWQRPSGLAKKFLADTYHLDLWVQRTIAKGAGLSPDLGALAAHLDVSEDKAQLDDLAARMGKAGGRDSKANVGTAIHAIVERILKGDGGVQYAPDLKTTVGAITELIRKYDIQAPFVEPFILTPDIVMGAGSADGLVTTNVTDPSKLTVFDLKTGQRNPRDFTTMTEWAVQLAIYANATHRWEGGDSQLVELPPINKEIALVLWAPSGGDHAELIGVDVAAGWELAKLCMQVKESRSKATAANMILELPKYRPGVTDSTTETPEHVQLMTVLASLRVRLRALTKRGVVTRQEIVDHWPADAPVLREANHNHEQTQWTVDTITAYVGRLEKRFGMDPADPTLAEATRTQIVALPADLAAQVRDELAAAGINLDDMRTRDIAEAGAALAGHDATVAARQATVDTWTGQARPIAEGALDYLAERCGLGGPENGYGEINRAAVQPLTADNLALFEALCTFYVARPDGSTTEGRAADIVDAYGGRAAAVTKAKELADTYGFDRPKSTEAIADNTPLAALVLFSAPAVTN